MQLQQLFFLWPEVKNHFTAESFVLGISQDSRKIKPGFVFIAVRGHGSDGHDHLENAVQNGALAVVVQDISKVPSAFKGFVLVVPNSLSALHFIATHFYGHPSQHMFCVGVTGTNGKTSTTLMIEWILNQCALPCAVIGTIDRHFQELKIDTSLTTPDPIELQENLNEFRKAGAQALAIEVSSHSLAQGRAEGISFDVAVFTNLTQDHLDYHQNMNAYFVAKERLFREHLLRTLKLNPVAVVNIDDPFGRRIRVPERALVMSYGESSSDLRYEIVETDFYGTKYYLSFDGERYEGRLPMIGRHNIANAVAAMGACLSRGYTLSEMMQILEKFPGVPGRLQRVSREDCASVFVDYAHTPDALFQVLNSIRLIRGNKKDVQIHVVFGCGGDRDKKKRPIMFETAAAIADFIYVTSDNPRTEEPRKILADILGNYFSAKGKSTASIAEGWIDGKIFVHTDRRTAIVEALKKSERADVVLVAGKGHEDYQILGNEKIYFSDVEEVKRFFR
jgi:UDP-N-acetylmuramoyl-L-alanyl-D-glutamate--2,6-diaminopimelate ligase